MRVDCPPPPVSRRLACSRCAFFSPAGARARMLSHPARVSAPADAASPRGGRAPQDRVQVLSPSSLAPQQSGGRMGERKQREAHCAHSPAMRHRPRHATGWGWGGAIWRVRGRGVADRTPGEKKKMGASAVFPGEGALAGAISRKGRGPRPPARRLPRAAPHPASRPGKPTRLSASWAGARPPHPPRLPRALTARPGQR